MRILARRDPVDPLWRNAVPEVVVGDLGDEAALARLCAGAEVVVHGAGLVKAASRAAFDAVNVTGARRLALAASSAPHVVLVSSLTAREPGLSHYSASKRAGETAMSEALGDRLTIARPCAIYGPGDRELLPVFQAADASPVLPIVNAAGRVAMVHVDDAGRQVAALATGRPLGRAVALSDARRDGYSWTEMMSAAAAACGRTPRLARVPGFLIRAIGITNDFTTLLGRAPMLSSAKVRELLHPDWAIAPEEGANDIPSPRYGLSEGFADTVAWYRSAAWMKHSMRFRDRQTNQR